MSGHHGIACAGVGTAQDGAMRAGLAASFAAQTRLRAGHGEETRREAVFMPQRAAPARHAHLAQLEACFAAAKTITAPIVI